MQPVKLLLSLLIAGSFACQPDQRNSTAIRDFSAQARPKLSAIISKNILYADSVFYSATDAELVRLSRSEHPVLRAGAFKEMLERESFDDFTIVMNNLDDTAFVAIDQGEFGIAHRMVSDYILENATWKTKEDWLKTLDRVLLKHNYLRSAYHILPQMEPQEKYYDVIKDMASRPRYRDPYGSERGFIDIEHALYGLAAYKRKEDIPLIKSVLSENTYELSYRSLKLMAQFPDTVYVDILKQYFRQVFLSDRYHYKYGGYFGTEYTGSEPRDFVDALMAQQNINGAQLLKAVLERLSTEKCLPYGNDINHDLRMAIWNSKNDVFTFLKTEIEPWIKKTSISVAGEFEVSDERPQPRDHENVRWYNF